MTVSPARRVALRVLSRIRRDEAFSGPVLSSALAEGELSERDASLTTRLTYGVLATLGVLDDALGRHVKGGLEPRVRDALRLATYELLFDRAPARAVVDQGVELVRSVRPQATRLANAVLRRLSEEADAFPWGDPLADRDALARATANPRWIVDLVLEDLGEDRGREMLVCSLDPAPVYARLDPFATDPDRTLEALRDAQPEPSEPDPECYRLGAPAVAFRGELREGWFPMDAAAQFAPRACAPKPGERLLDLGAGRGNKTICLQALAVRNGGSAQIVAVEHHHGKVDSLERRLAGSRVPDVRVLAADIRELGGVLGDEKVDAVLLDAPCTGLGTLRRYPEKRWRIEPDAPERMATLQREMLASAAQPVRVGGRLVYSTCSVARAENGQVVEAFLASDAGNGFEVAPLDEAIPEAWGIFRDERRCFQSWPRPGGPDGHYVAMLRRVRA